MKLLIKSRSLTSHEQLHALTSFSKSYSFSPINLCQSMFLDFSTVNALVSNDKRGTIDGLRLLEYLQG
jgi:hypothetical protein